MGSLDIVNDNVQDRRGLYVFLVDNPVSCLGISRSCDQRDHHIMASIEVRERISKMEIVELAWWGVLGFLVGFLWLSVLTQAWLAWRKHKRASSMKFPRCSICDAEIEPGFRKYWLCGDDVNVPYSEQICEECYYAILPRQKAERDKGKTK